VKRKFRVLAVLGTVAATTTAVLAVSIPADASASNAGKYPSKVSGCQTNKRVGKTTGIYSSKVYYGWAEMRYSGRGKCAGLQWIRLHVTKRIPNWDENCLRGEDEQIITANYLKKEGVDGRHTQWTNLPVASHTKPDSNGHNCFSYTATGTHDTKMIWALDSKCGGKIDGFDAAYRGLFFGAKYKPKTWVTG
jgi:hypothetical protein